MEKGVLNLKTQITNDAISIINARLVVTMGLYHDLQMTSIHSVHTEYKDLRKDFNFSS